MRPEPEPASAGSGPNTSSPLPPTAFLGLGALGAAMAVNLHRAGCPLQVWNRTPGRQAEVAELAALPRCSTAAEAVAAAQVVCLCLSDDEAVSQVLLGEAPNGGEPLVDGEGGSLLEVLPAETLVVDFSTIAPATSRRLAAALEAQSHRYLDAPVTGGTEGAWAGRLSVLVGGRTRDVERARPHLEAVGSTITHLGAVGAGQEAKAVNQVLVAGSYGAVAEAMALGRRMGLPMEQVVEALRSGAAGSWALENRSRQMLEGSYPLGFRLALHRKDLGIALAAAEAMGLQLPLSEQVAAQEDHLIAGGHGDDDVSALAEWFRD